MSVGENIVNRVLKIIINMIILVQREVYAHFVKENVRVPGA
jgi:hypothetical protein